MRWRSITGAYLAGAGVNAIVPARGGDVTKIYLAHRSMPGAAYTTVTSSLIAETLIDLLIGPVLLIAAYSTGRLPHLPAIGHLPAFEWSFFEANGRLFVLVLAVLLIPRGVFFTYIERHVNSFWSRIADGVAILRTPQALLPQVVSLQLAGWCCRVAAMYWFLEAFRHPRIDPRCGARAERRQRRDAVAADSGRHRSAAGAARLHVPRRRAGIGVLSFSVGMQFAITLLNVDRRRDRALADAAPAALERAGAQAARAARARPLLTLFRPRTIMLVMSS